MLGFFPPFFFPLYELYRKEERKIGDEYFWKCHFPQGRNAADVWFYKKENCIWCHLQSWTKPKL